MLEVGLGLPKYQFIRNSKPRWHVMVLQKQLSNKSDIRRLWKVRYIRNTDIDFVFIVTNIYVYHLVFSDIQSRIIRLSFVSSNQIYSLSSEKTSFSVFVCSAIAENFNAYIRFVVYIIVRFFCFFFVYDVHIFC